MFVIPTIAAIGGVIAAILLAVCSKRDKDYVYTTRDKVGRIINILLVPIYAVLGIFCMAFGMFSYPAYDGFLGILGWLVAVIVSAAPLFCGLALGFSVALRKKGRSKLSFGVQFLGFAGTAVSLTLFALAYGNLLQHLN